MKIIDVIIESLTTGVDRHRLTAAIDRMADEDVRKYTRSDIDSLVTSANAYLHRSMANSI